MIKTYTKISQNVGAAQFNFTNALSLIEKLHYDYLCEDFQIHLPPESESMLVAKDRLFVTFTCGDSSSETVMVGDYIIFNDNQTFEIVPEKDFNKNYKINA
jgi:hypothetical protein